MTRERLESIKQKHGEHASWAVWADPGARPKSNVGDMSIFDLDSNPGLLQVLNTNAVMVGLNLAADDRLLPEDFRNFHDPSPRANDFKIRYAFRGTEYYGAYMTDVIKDFGMLQSRDVVAHLKAHPEIVAANIERFREELQDLGAEPPIILAFGVEVYRILKEHLQPGEYSRLVKLTHYSHYISKEQFRAEVVSKIE